MLLQDKVALITGGGAGIGAATAKAFTEHGARVIIADSDADAAAATESEIRAAGGDVRSRVVDASSPDELDALFDFVDAEFGRLDVLHNNHMWAEGGRLDEISLEGFRRSLDVGLTAYFYATKLATRLMVPRGSGAIVNTASVCGLQADYGLSAYNVMKAGVINLSRATALDFALSGIRCNAVCPGPTLTKPYAELREREPDRYGRTAAAVPMRRFGETSEVADVIVFLASDMASFVTGTTLVVDGGLTAWTGLPPLADLRGD
jgi:meso-butanediol dehydrogenase/(S,S)-butanediol dehydrogenase/diacetyl reductase